MASDLVLWKNVDLSFGWIKKSDLCFYWLCDNKLPQVRSLDLSGWEKIVKDEQLQVKCKTKYVRVASKSKCLSQNPSPE